MSGGLEPRLKQKHDPNQERQKKARQDEEPSRRSTRAATGATPVYERVLVSLLTQIYIEGYRVEANRKRKNTDADDEQSSKDVQEEDEEVEGQEDAPVQ